MLDVRIPESKLIREKAVKPLSFNGEKRSEFSEKHCFQGNTKDEPNSVDGTGQIEKPDHYVQEAPTPIYKIALSVDATKEERSAFNNYQETVKQAGWSVVSIPVSTSEESAFVVVPNCEKGKVRAATYMAESMLGRALQGACRGWK